MITAQTEEKNGLQNDRKMARPDVMRGEEVYKQVKPCRQVNKPRYTKKEGS